MAPAPLIESQSGFLYVLALTLIFAAPVALMHAMRQSYPGPTLPKLTKWILRWHTALNNREKYIDNLHKRYGPLVQIAPNHVSVNNADGIHEIFSVTRRLDRPGAMPFLHMYQSENLVSTVKGDLHQERRKPLRSFYTARAVEVFIDSESQNGQPLDALRLSRLFAADLMSHVVYGSENSMNSLEDTQLRKDLELNLSWFFDRLINFGTLFMLWYPNTALWLRRIGLAPASLGATVPDDLVLDKKGRLVMGQVFSSGYKPPANRPQSLMERTVQEYKEKGASTAIPDTDYILSETLDHFGAGVTTTTDALGAAFYQLSLPQNKMRQSKLREELQKAGVDSSTEVTFSVIKSIDYLDFVVKETLRFSPPIPTSMERKVTSKEGLEVLGYQIPRGMEVSAQAYSVHRNPDAFDDADEWSPERWAVEEADKFRQMKRHSFAFSKGPRMCLGMNIATTEMKMLLARIYSVYETKLSSDWFRENGELRSEDELGELWPRKSLLPLKRRQPILFQRVQNTSEDEVEAHVTG